jgi:hypothetical protein
MKPFRMVHGCLLIKGKIAKCTWEYGGDIKIIVIIKN